MNVFPKFGTIDEAITKTLLSRAGNNLAVSQLVPWLRVSSGAGNGLIIESVKANSSFKDTYGNNEVSGIVGTSFDGTPRRAYGTTRGLRPSPIIESIDLEAGSYGLSRKARFNIKCFTLAQAELVTKYFLEPGFHVLVEYGWNTSSALSQAPNPLSACEMAKFNSYNHIIGKRMASGGTYDGFMGKITGGSVSLSDDETYIVETKILTIGEVPAYLQTHKGAVSGEDDGDETNQTGNEYDISNIDAWAEGNQKWAEAIWAQMYNRLPPHKRTLSVKNLLNKKDKYGRYLKAPFNFINMDDKVRELIVEDFTKLSAKKDDGKSVNVSVPDGVKIITDQSYIRLEVAFRILNDYQLELNSQDTADCAGIQTQSYIIDVNNVIIGAHKYMFSTNDSKLYIPNTNLPDFGLKSMLTSEVEATPRISIDKPVNGSPWKKDYKGQQDIYAFPATTNLESDAYYGKIKKFSGVSYTDSPAGTWGYLGNLYINFDFFISVLNKNNYTSKDCYYEILNALSDSCNSFWQFEIIEAPDNDPDSKGGMTRLTVVDLNFSGKAVETEIVKFDSSGVNCPFLKVDMDMELGGAMASRIMAQQLGSDTVVEDRPLKVKGFFSTNLTDNVFPLVTPIKKATEQKDGEKSAEKGIWDKAVNFAKDLFGITLAEQRGHNIEVFSNSGRIIPLNQDRKVIKNTFLLAESADMSGENFVVGFYNDALALKILELGEYSKLNRKSNSESLHPALLPINVTLETIGISGIKVGDLFKLTGLPINIDKPFQVKEITQSLTSDMWTTTIKAQIRNM